MLKIIEKILRRIDKDYEVKKLIHGGAVIGDNFFAGGSYLDPGFLFLIEIGNNVTLSNAALLAHDASTKKIVGKSRVGKIKIGNNVFVGYGTIILPGVSIGDNVVIGAGSVVTHNIPANSIAAGNPCRNIGTYSDFSEKHRNNMKNHPIYLTYHAHKCADEIQQMQRELDTTWGFDE